MPKDVTCSPRTHRHTDRQTHRVTTVGTLSGFQDFFLQPIIKDRPKNNDGHMERYQAVRNGYESKYDIKQG